jgi:hypothetical protein
MSEVLPITEILAIEDDILDNTFLNVTFGSQSLLEPTSDQTGSDTNWRTGEGDQKGGGEWEPIKIPQQNLPYVPKLTQRASLLSRSRLRSYRQDTSSRNRVRKPQITAETWIDASKNMCETMLTKIRLKISLSPHRHFTEHLVGVFGKPPRESD